MTTSARATTIPAMAPDELTDIEAALLEAADELDSGTLAERLADAAHHAAHDATTTATELRQLAAYALTLARRVGEGEIQAGYDEPFR